MTRHDVDFLNRCLDRFPGLERSIRLYPPAVWRSGRWRPIEAVRLWPGRLEVRERGGNVLYFPLRRGPAGQRRDHIESLTRLARRRFPGYVCRRVLAKTDRNRHQSAEFLRIELRRAGRLRAVLAAYPSETSGRPERLCTSAVLWWNHLNPRPGDGLVLLVPESWSQGMLDCLEWLDLSAVCLVYDGALQRMTQIFPCAAPSSFLASPYRMFQFGGSVPPLLAGLCERDPELDLIYRQKGWEIGFRGIPVAWEEPAEKEILFDFDAPRRLTSIDEPDFQRCLLELKQMRRLPSADPGNAGFRLAPERWLESLVLRNLSQVNADFATPVYCQVPTCVEGERKVLDLLAVTRSRRLAVLEIKVERDLALIFQGLAYWKRVEVHRRNGDFQQAGYFEGIRLSQEPALLYLVCPLFEFHRVLPSISRRLKPVVEIHCVGVNADWKRSLKVLRKFRL